MSSLWIQRNMSFLSMLNGRLRVAGCGGPLVAVDSTDDPCCCDECTYEFCIVNANQILDNSWDVFVNNNRIGNFSGEPFANVCFAIATNFLNIPGDNTLKFTRQNCVNDDLFEFEISKTCEDVREVVFADSSTLLNPNGAGGTGNCTDDEFTRNFGL